jgi:hypothetical protein
MVGWMQRYGELAARFDAGRPITRRGFASRRLLVQLNEGKCNRQGYKDHSSELD